VAVIFKDRMMGIGFTISMRNFVENPAALTFLLSLPSLIGWAIPPIVNFASDCFWTRWGRRKPFIILSWVGTITTLGLMPLAPDFWSLLACYLTFSIFNSLAGPVESLKMEVVPPAQRVVSSAIMAWIGQLAVLMFWVVGIGRFDEVTTFFGGALVGESALYWSASIGMVVMLAFLMLGIREIKPQRLRQKSSSLVRSAFGNLISFHLWGVYILAFSTAILGTGLGAMNTLLYVEQFGVTNQEMGYNIAIGGLLNIALIPLLGLLANKVGKGGVYVGLVIAGMVVNVSMYIYFHNFLDDGRPTLLEMVVFGEMLSVIGVLKGMALTPLVYDFIRRDELGTYSAGQGLINQATNYVTTNFIGLFVTWYAVMLLAPPGERVRVTFRDDLPRERVEATLTATRAGWELPFGVDELRLHATPWYANGSKLDHGRGYELRLRDDHAELLRTESDRLEAARKKAETRERFLRQAHGVPAAPASATAAAESPVTPSATRINLRDPAADVADILAEAEALNARLSIEKGDPIAGEAAAKELLTTARTEIQDELKRRAGRFQRQVEQHFSTQLLRSGEEILGAATAPAVITTRSLMGTLDTRALERFLDGMRRTKGSLIDLAVVKRDEVYTLEISALCDGRSPAETAAAIDSVVTSTLAGSGEQRAKWRQLIGPSATTGGLRETVALVLDLRLLEDPIDRHPSPITRISHNFLRLVGVEPPRPERRFAAVGRGLRRAGWVDHASASALPGDNYAIRVTALMGTRPNDAEKQLGKLATPADEVPQQRLGELLGSSSAAANDLYCLAGQAARDQRLTVARPILLSDTSKQRYDYLAGYIPIFILQVIGLCVTFIFLRMVKTGKLRRRGVEEAEATR
jgi:Na+/melibiose symporter-like transporter